MRIFRAGFALLLVISSSLLANQLNFEKFNVEDGLSHEIIRGAVQDHRGFLWFATEGGLDRYDGFSFQHFDLVLNNPGSSNLISDIALDKSGDIWLSTLGSGIYRFNPITNVATSIGGSDISSKHISKLFIDSENNIWAGTLENGLNLISSDAGITEITTFLPGNKSISHGSITAITEDNYGRIWVGTDGGGVDIYDPENVSWNNITRVYPNNKKVAQKQIRSLFMDSNRNMWIGSATNGVFKLDLSRNGELIAHYETVASSKSSLINNRVLSIFEDREQNIWFGTDGGLSILDGETFRNLNVSRENPQGLSNNRILDIFQDKSGLVWIGTYSGLNKLNPKNSVFNHIIPSSQSGLDSRFVMDFTMDANSSLYVATYGGGILVQTEDLGWESITTEEGLAENRITSIFVDNEDGIWAGTRASGLLYKSNSSDEWIQFKNNSTDDFSLISNGVTDIHQDKSGDIWISTYSGGLSKKVENGFVNITRNSQQTSSLSSQNIFQILEGQNGFLWLASDNGINKVNVKDFSVELVSLANDSPNGGVSAPVLQLFEDSKGNIWIGTQGQGVLFWDVRNKTSNVLTFDHYTQKDGLASDTIYAFSEDDTGNIWFSSAKGIGKIDSSTFEIENFDKSHGLQGYDYNLSSVFKDPNGNIYFGGTNGYNFFDPSKITKNTTPPNVELLAITAVADPVPIPQDGQGIVLDYNDYLVSLDYVALDFAAPEKNQYQYKLEGFDTDWIDVDNRRRATYTNLPAGEYDFVVKAANNDGVWSEPQVHLPIKVNPAPWRTSYAYTLYTLVIGLIIFSFLRNQMRKLAAEERQRKALEVEVAARTNELAEQNQTLQKLNQDLETAHHTDALTGTHNRRFLDAYLTQALLKYQSFDANNPSFMEVILLDINDLKPINDQFGHAGGDAVINHVAKTLQQALPIGYELIRWGGDDFMIIGATADRAETKQLINRLLDSATGSEFSYLENSIQISCSAGFAHYPFDDAAPNAMSWDQVSTLADKALSWAKLDSNSNWCGLMKPRRDVNDLYISELIRCQDSEDAEDLVEITRG